eukprot:GHVU01063376.1.p1 GENE.GHVU01063376.1~~GHVU01063376.1.p1  ORF type:complete len:185 (+),score=15.15 GHVU01063376.1:117-671(+)
MLESVGRTYVAACLTYVTFTSHRLPVRLAVRRHDSPPTGMSYCLRQQTHCAAQLLPLPSEPPQANTPAPPSLTEEEDPDCADEVCERRTAIHPVSLRSGPRYRPNGSRRRPPAATAAAAAAAVAAYHDDHAATSAVPIVVAGIPRAAEDNVVTTGSDSRRAGTGTATALDTRAALYMSLLLWHR